MNKDRLGALIFLSFSLAYTLLAFDIKVPKEEVLNARTLPLALGTLGCIVAFLMLLIPPLEPSASLSEIFSGLNYKPVFWLSVCMVIYGFIITRLGFILSTVFFLNAGFYILGEKRVKVMFYASIPLVTAFWFILTKVLGLYLAPGSLFS